MFGVIQTLDIVPCLSQQMRMPALSAWHIQNLRAGCELKNIEKSRDLLAVTLQLEDRLVFEKIVRVEIRLPPLGFLLQKNTGSR